MIIATICHSELDSGSNNYLPEILNRVQDDGQDMALGYKSFKELV